MNIMESKRGEISSEQLVITVIAILGFVIVLIFWASIKFSYTQDEICKFSVLSRATTPVDAARGVVPLKCGTKKICITDGNGKCEAYFSGETNVEYVNIDSSKRAEAAQTIAQINVEQLYGCWDLMGQGKLEIFPKSVMEKIGLKPDSDNGCVICARIAIDDKINDKDVILNLVDVSTYMRDNQVPGKALTYLQAMTDRGVNSYPSISQDSLDQSKSGADTVQLKADSSEKAIIFSQRITKTDPAYAVLNFWKTTSAVAGGAFVFAPTRSLLTGVIKGGTSLVGGWVAVGAAAVSAITVSVVSYTNAYNVQMASVGYCGEFTGGDEKSAKQGCSITSSVPYSYSNVNKLCTFIDGDL
jgi:hypothetical protein